MWGAFNKNMGHSLLMVAHLLEKGSFLLYGDVNQGWVLCAVMWWD